VALPKPHYGTANKDSGKQGDEKINEEGCIHRGRKVSVDEWIHDKADGMAVCYREGRDHAPNNKEKGKPDKTDHD
jgi:hypothetical protein